MKNAYEISGEKLAETYLVDRVGCWGCVIKCSRVSKVPSGPYYTPRSEGPEYESVWALASLTGINDWAPVVKMNYLANDLGFDTISLGNTLATAIDLVKRGLVPKELLNGLDIKWDNADALIELMYRMAMRADEFASAAADGAPVLAEKFGAPDLAMHVRGLELPAYDPRGIKGMALAYATSNRGGCHLRSYPVAVEVLGHAGGKDIKLDPLAVTDEKAGIVNG